MNIPAEFDAIRPYSPEELPAAFDALLADPAFRRVVAAVQPQMPFEAFSAALRSCHTNLEVQKKMIYPIVQRLEEELTLGVDFDSSAISTQGHYTFISNHRDIVLDPALLSKHLVENGFPTTVEIAIGDNLLIYPWIRCLVRINKSFIVQRSASMRQMLQSSARMSRYMHFAIAQKHENIWIAQREGRAKDSNDRTQDSIIKMMTMGGEGTPAERLQALHLVPLAISYEYDPCDFLKAKEFQQRRDNPEWHKTQADDLRNMQTGILGYKGHVHYQAAPCLDVWLGSLPADLGRQEFADLVARRIDRAIHLGYRLYPSNYIAADLLSGTRAEADHYTAEDEQAFADYLRGQIEKIDLPHPDEAFLRKCLLTMYAYPLRNQRAAESTAP